MIDREAEGQAPRRGIFLGYGLRPFFLFAGVYGALGMAPWLAWLAIHGAGGAVTGFDFPLPMYLWHAHELIYGYVAAVIAGFLLTAVPTWLDSPILPRRPLMMLAGTWLAGRAAMWLAPLLPYELVALLDLAFLVHLLVLVAAPLWRRRARRQFVFVAALAALVAANVMFHAEGLSLATDWASRGLVLAVDTVLLLLAIVGGRIVPAFTTSALRRKGQEPGIAALKPLEAGSVLSIAALIVAELTLPDTALAAVIAALAAVLNGVRLARWRTLSSLDQSLLWVLHLGYGWLVLGLAAKSLAHWDAGLSQAAATHIVTVGAVGTMTLAVMSRAALGHTGRPLIAPRAAVVAYLLVSLAALVRVAGPALLAAYYLEAVLASGGLWIAAFAVFTAIYGPILTAPRVDGRPG